MKLSKLLEPMFEILDLRPGANSKYPTKKFDYEEWKRLSKSMNVDLTKKVKDKKSDKEVK